MTLIAQVVNFLILVAILAKFAYKPLLKAMADRQARIANDLQSAEQERVAAQQLHKEYLDQMAQAKAQSQAILDKAVKTAESMKQEILEEARLENARLLKSAQDEIARQTELAIAGLREEVVSMSLAAAAKVIDKEMNSEANTKLVADFIEKWDEKKVGNLPC
ncbi:MAG: atpF [Firmicutes bacterium]|nr:atpF [Bacillota bacterium]